MLDINKSQEIAEFMRAHHHYGSKQFAEALNEVEHLRIKIEETRRDLLKAKTNNQCFKRLIKKQSGEIEELKDDLETAKASLRFDREEIERLRAKVGKMEFLMRSTDDTCLACAIKLEVIDQQAARIQELEDALVEEGTKGLFNGPWDSGLSCGGYDEEMAACRREARRRLQAEGKIGPEDAKPRSWQITEERKAAIQMGLDYLEYAYAKSGRGDIHEHAGQLRAMLKEAGQ
jgi:hypothetical protein